MCSVMERRVAVSSSRRYLASRAVRGRPNGEFQVVPGRRSFPRPRTMSKDRHLNESIGCCSTVHDPTF